MSRKATADCHYSVRVPIVGDPGVGKSAILRAFSSTTRTSRDKTTTNVFRANDPSAVGIRAKDTVVERYGLKVKITWWDATGAARYREATAKMCSGSAGLILVYDVANEQSFDSLREWSQLIVNSAETPRCVVANKSDTPRDEWSVLPELGQTFASEIGAQYVETSAMTVAGIDHIFETTANTILNRLALVTAPTVQWMAASSIKISRHKPVALAYHDDLTSNHDWL